MSVDVRIHPGVLPRFWDRNVVFFANLLSLFYGNEEETQSLREEVGRIESYGGRLAPILNILFKGGNNLLVLEREPDVDLMSYFERDLALSIPELVVLPHQRYVDFPEQVEAGLHGLPEDYHLIANHTAGWIDGFVTDEHVIQIAQSLGKSTLSGLEGSKRGNNKYLLHRFLEDEGLPTFETVYAGSMHELPAAARDMYDRGYAKAVVKAQVGASGIGMEIIDTSAGSAIEVPAYMFYEGPCLVQGWLDEGHAEIREVYSPSVQLFLDHEAISLYDITEQILSEDSIHQGNHSPPPYFREHPQVREDLLACASEVGKWLHAQAYRGTASIDFVVVAEDSGMRVIVCEINARITGATYPSVLARHFVPEGSWIMRNLALEKPMRGAQILSEIADEKCLYATGDAGGILPINFNFDRDGLIDKGQFLFVAEDQEGCIEMMDEIEDALPIDWAIDRD